MKFWYTRRNIVTILDHVEQKTYVQSFFWIVLNSLGMTLYPAQSLSSNQGFPGINLEFQGFQGFFRTKI